MRRLILGTAGHIDHGKTALVRALTGVDTDRLPEEKRRGITIELGFAALSLGDVHLGIVDVPGHEALVRTMLAGAAGMDIVMLVIAADEGVMPQTREHLAIMELLEVRAAVVALTKSDVVDAEWLELVATDVAETLESTRFAGARVIPVSSRTGDGLDALRAEISSMAAAISDRAADDIFRLPVDRVFTRHGTGTVVTGTVWSGMVPRDAALRVWPGGSTVRVRGLEVHGSTRQDAAAGERVALAVAVERDAIRRGDVLTSDPGWQETMLITARLRVLADAQRPLRHRQRIRFHLGTSEILGRIAMLSGEAVEAGAAGWVQVRLEAPCVARAGDRFVIRSYSPVETIAGGVIVEPSPPKRKRLTGRLEPVLNAVLDGSTLDAVTHLVTASGAAGIAAADLPVLTGRTPADISAALVSSPFIRIADRLFDASLGDAARARIGDAVDDHHATEPMDAGLPRDALRGIIGVVGQHVTAWAVDRLIAEQRLLSVEGALARPGFRPSMNTDQYATADALLAEIARAGLEAPSTADLGGAAVLPILRFLAGTGQIVPLPDDRWVGAEPVQALIQRLATVFHTGQNLTTTDLKDSIGLTRKYLIPMLEYFDRTGITRRTAENRTWLGRSDEQGGTSQSTAVPAPHIVGGTSLDSPLPAIYHGRVG